MKRKTKKQRISELVETIDDNTYNVLEEKELEHCCGIIEQGSIERLHERIQEKAQDIEDVPEFMGIDFDVKEEELNEAKQIILTSIIKTNLYRAHLNILSLAEYQLKYAEEAVLKAGFILRDYGRNGPNGNMVYLYSVYVSNNGVVSND